MQRLVVIFALLSMALLAPAAVTPPVLNGVASFDELRQPVFLAGLYLDASESSAAAVLQAPGSKQMVYKITRTRLSLRKFTTLLLQSAAINNSTVQLSATNDTMVTFVGLFKGSLMQGDILTLTLLPDAAAVDVHLNDTLLATLDNPAFFFVLLNTWLGPVPPGTEFKQALLGAADANMVGQFMAVQPSELRRRQIAAWMAPPVIEQELAVTTATVDATTSTVPEPMAVADSELAVNHSAVAAPVVAPVVAPVAGTPVVSVSLAAGEPLPAENNPPLPQTTEAPAVFDEEEDLPLLTSAQLEQLQFYTASLVQLTHQHIEYPRRAMQLHQTGSVRMAVVINKDGKVVTTQPLLESEFSQLNKAVERAVRHAAPYPEIPEALATETFEFVFPITFMLENS